MGLQITNNGGESFLIVDVNTEKSTATSIVVEFSGANDIYVGTWIVHLWNDPDSDDELEMLDVKEIYIERSASGSVTFSGLTPNTTYYIGVVTGDYSTWGEDSFSFTTPLKPSGVTTHERNGFTWTEDITSNSVIITIQSHPGGDGIGHPYDLYRIHPDTGEPIWVDGGEKIWEVHPNTAFSYSFYNLEANTKYQLSTYIPELGDIEFTTANVGGIPDLSLSYDSLTDSSVRAVLSEDPSGYYDFWTWYIQKVGETTILDRKTESSSRKHLFRNLEGDTRYYIWVELEEVESETLDILGMYVTTPPTEGLFYWTYSGIKKNDDGTYEHVLGGTKGVNADYFFITATEWNEYVTKLCEVKDSEGITDFTHDGTLTSLQVKDNDPFTATLYSNVLGILWSMDGIGEELLNENFVDVGITPSHLNSIKDRLNDLIG